jgi:hypothetical protein
MSADDPSGVEFNNCLLASRPICNALYMSLQRAMPLRSDFVNDIFSTSGSTAHPFDDDSAHRPPVPPYAPLPAGSTAHPFDDDSAHRPPVPPHVPLPAGASPPLPDFFPYSTDQKWTVALLKLLDDMNAPDYAFHATLTWARAAIADGFSFPPEGGKTRRRNVERLFAMISNAKQLLPTVRTVAVPHGPRVMSLHLILFRNC